MSDDFDFGTPVYVDELPPKATTGGRKSAAPAIVAWMGQIAEGKTAELPSKDPDGAHTVGRVSLVRKHALPGFNVDTRPVETGKRYRIFVTNTNGAAADNGKAPARK